MKPRKHYWGYSIDINRQEGHTRTDKYSSIFAWNLIYGGYKKVPVEKWQCGNVARTSYWNEKSWSENIGSSSFWVLPLLIFPYFQRISRTVFDNALRFFDVQFSSQYDRENMWYEPLYSNFQWNMMNQELERFSFLVGVLSSK